VPIALYLEVGSPRTRTRYILDVEEGIHSCSISSEHQRQTTPALPRSLRAPPETVSSPLWATTGTTGLVRGRSTPSAALKRMRPPDPAAELGPHLLPSPGSREHGYLMPSARGCRNLRPMSIHWRPMWGLIVPCALCSGNAGASGVKLWERRNRLSRG
jgi:hypothetical protein